MKKKIERLGPLDWVYVHWSSGNGMVWCIYSFSLLLKHISPYCPLFSHNSKHKTPFSSIHTTSHYTKTVAHMFKVTRSHQNNCTYAQKSHICSKVYLDNTIPLKAGKNVNTTELHYTHYQKNWKHNVQSVRLFFLQFHNCQTPFRNIPILKYVLVIYRFGFHMKRNYSYSNEDTTVITAQCKNV